MGRPRATSSRAGRPARWWSAKPGDEDAVARGLRRDSAAQKQWFESLRVVSPVFVMRPGLPVRLGTKCAISRRAVSDLCASGNQPAPPLERRTDITGRKPSSPTASSGGLLTAGCHRSFAPVMLVAVWLRTPQEALTHVVMRSLSCSHLVLGRISCGYHCYRGGRARDCYSPPASTDHRGQSWLSWGRGVAASPPTLNQSAMTMTP
jgi:hypothetical protein